MTPNVPSPPLERRAEHRRQSDANDPLWLRAGKQFGAPTVMLAALIWFITQTVGANIERVRDEQTRVATELALAKNDQAATLATLKNHEAQSQRQLETISLLLRQICTNGAGTSAERSECFRVFQQ